MKTSLHQKAKKVFKQELKRIKKLNPNVKAKLLEEGLVKSLGFKDLFHFNQIVKLEDQEDHRLHRLLFYLDRKYYLSMRYHQDGGYYLTTDFHEPEGRVEFLSAYELTMFQLNGFFIAVEKGMAGMPSFMELDSWSRNWRVHNTEIQPLKDTIDHLIKNEDGSSRSFDLGGRGLNNEVIWYLRLEKDFGEDLFQNGSLLMDADAVMEFIQSEKSGYSHAFFLKIAREDIAAHSLRQHSAELAEFGVPETDIEEYATRFLSPRYY